MTAKVVALLVFIALGTIALKRGRNRTVRAIAGVLAILTFMYIFRVATTKQLLTF